MIHGQAGAMQINICTPGQIEVIYSRYYSAVSPSAAAGLCSDQLTDARRQLQLQLMCSSSSSCCTAAPQLMYADQQSHP